MPCLEQHSIGLPKTEQISHTKKRVPKQARSRSGNDEKPEKKGIELADARSGSVFCQL